MKLWLVAVLFAGIGVFIQPIAAPAASDEAVQALLKEVKALRARVTDLEKRLGEAQACALRAEKKSLEAVEMAREFQAHSVKLSRQMETLTPKEAPALMSQLGKRLSIYGNLELEGSWQRYKPKHGQDSTTSDLNLATAEIFFEASINKYVRGVLHFLWEEGKTEPVDLDEGFILVGQTDDMPFYFLGGRIYPAIGLFETYLISDPITQNVFETQDTAGEVGYTISWLNIGAGVFNSKVHESADAPDSTINTYYARVQVQNPEGSLGGLKLRGGVAYINNIASSGTLADEISGQEVKNLVAGWSAMLAAEYGRFAFNAEYITALDDFGAGELGFAGENKARPMAYNLELAFMPFEKWSFAVRYEGSSDLYSLEPERQWGIGASWEFLPDTVLSLEYLRGEYRNDDERDLFTTQLAVGF